MCQESPVTWQTGLRTTSISSAPFRPGLLYSKTRYGFSIPNSRHLAVASDSTFSFQLPRLVLASDTISTKKQIAFFSVSAS